MNRETNRESAQHVCSDVGAEVLSLFAALRHTVPRASLKPRKKADAPMAIASIRRESVCTDQSGFDAADQPEPRVPNAGSANACCRCVGIVCSSLSTVGVRFMAAGVRDATCVQLGATKVREAAAAIESMCLGGLLDEVDGAYENERSVGAELPKRTPKFDFVHVKTVVEGTQAMDTTVVSSANDWKRPSAGIVGSDCGIQFYLRKLTARGPRIFCCVHVHVAQLASCRNYYTAPPSSKPTRG